MLPLQTRASSTYRSVFRRRPPRSLGSGGGRRRRVESLQKEGGGGGGGGGGEPSLMRSAVSRVVDRSFSASLHLHLSISAAAWEIREVEGELLEIWRGSGSVEIDIGKQQGVL